MARKRCTHLRGRRIRGRFTLRPATHWEKEQEEAYKKEWKDVIQFREEERGDVINRMDVAQALACATAKDTKPCDAATGVKQMATTPCG